MRLALVCEKCGTALKHPHSALLWCAKCDLNWTHPLLDRIFAAGIARGSADKVNEFRAFLNV